jgi:hypothetical protein
VVKTAEFGAHRGKALFCLNPDRRDALVLADSLRTDEPTFLRVRIGGPVLEFYATHIGPSDLLCESRNKHSTTRELVEMTDLCDRWSASAA